jgi:hypothetical protein
MGNTTERDRGTKDMKALGKKPPECKGCPGCNSTDCWREHDVREHYRQALIEAADELERIGTTTYPIRVISVSTPIYLELIRCLKISAGVK